MVTIQHFLKNTQPFSAYVVSVRLLLDFCSFSAFVQFCALVRFSAFCSITRCIFYSDTGIVFQVFRSHVTTTIRQSINIILQTVPSLP
jgi:hypothetical protein